MMSIKRIKPSETWQIRHEVMWPNQPFEFVQLEEDKEGLHFGYFIEEKLVSIVSCFIVGDEMQFRKLATLVEYQGKGIATALLEYLFEFAKDKKIKKIWCNARRTKKSFYEKLGMKDTCLLFTKAEIDFTIMEMYL